MTAAPLPWLAELEGSYRDAQEEEEHELAGQEGNGGLLRNGVC